jgi:hypothetical protein
MKPIKRSYVKTLASWGDRPCAPASESEEGQRIQNTIYDLNDELDAAVCNARGQWLPESKLTINQLRACAFASFSGAVPMDGLVVGVLVNKPRIFELVVDAAKSLALRRVSKQLQRVSDVLPPAFWKLKKVDDRLEWLEKHEKVAKALARIEDSEKFDDARFEMMLVAASIALDNPDEFFKKK